MEDVTGVCRLVLGTEGAKRGDGGKKRQKWIDGVRGAKGMKKAEECRNRMRVEVRTVIIIIIIIIIII